MLDPIAESDWKVFRELFAIVLDRFCERALSEASRTMADTSQSVQGRFFDVVKLLKDQNKILTDELGDFRRSTAVLQLIRMRSYDLLSDEELARFSQETHERVRRFLETDRA